MIVSATRPVCQGDRITTVFQYLSYLNAANVSLIFHYICIYTRYWDRQSIFTHVIKCLYSPHLLLKGSRICPVYLQQAIWRMKNAYFQKVFVIFKFYITAMFYDDWRQIVPVFLSFMLFQNKLIQKFSIIFLLIQMECINNSRQVWHIQIAHITPTIIGLYRGGHVF